MLKPAPVALVIPYFGKFPAYLSYFLETCVFNKNIDFWFFCDTPWPGAGHTASNIRVESMTLLEFNALATSKLEVEVALTSAYKLCDLKPMYGRVFEDYLRPYKFWGFCDVDILLGDTAKVLTAKLLDEFDVISAHALYLSGPFSLFRNTQNVNDLFKKSADVGRVISDPRVLLFDEASNALPHLWAGRDIADFKAEIESMTHLLKNPLKCLLRVNFAGFITERVAGELTWQAGKLHDEEGREVFVFHYIVYKNRFDFGILPNDFKSGQPFYFYKGGLHTGSAWRKHWLRLSSMLHNTTRRAFRKLRSYASSR